MSTNRMYPTNTPIEPERNLLLLIIRLVIIKSTYLVLIGANEMSGILLVWQIYKTPLYITLTLLVFNKDVSRSSSG